MAKDERQSPRPDSGGPDPAKWARFDAVARWLLLVGFVAFAAATCFCLWLIQQQLESLEARVAEEKQSTVEADFWKLTREGTTPEMRTESFLRLVRAGNAEWRLTRLNELDLDNAALNGTNLQYAQFNACSFKKAQLRNVEMTGGGFELCDLIDANLQEIRMPGGQVFRCTIKRANLQNASLVRGRLEQTRFFDVKMYNADLTEANLELAVIQDSDLQNVNLTSANLKGTKIIRSDLRAARLPQALLVNTDFTDSNWWRARGLPPRMIEEYRKRFPPSKDAPKTIREDWELWQKTGG